MTVTEHELKTYKKDLKSKKVKKKSRLINYCFIIETVFNRYNSLSVKTKTQHTGFHFNSYNGLRGSNLLPVF